MVGKFKRWQGDVIVVCPLRQVIPDDHILVRINTILDLSWLADEVADSYCLDNGRRSIAPEAALRLMLAGFFQGITRDRELLREAQVNIAIRWFIGYELQERLPHHSSLTRIRQRWGEERFRRIFDRVVAQCVTAGLVNGRTVHVDATLIRADASWKSMTRHHVDRVLADNPLPSDGPEPDRSSGGAGPTRRWHSRRWRAVG